MSNALLPIQATMTYGEFLRHCRQLAGIETTTEFARLVGYKNPDHYIGAENDKKDKGPSLDMMQRAAGLAGVRFDDYIQIPSDLAKPLSPKDEHLHRQLQQLLDLDNDQVGDWFALAVAVFYKAYFHRR